jgi:pyruvate dehydrogenase E2 component (dihydrolipoamide acetyltransferase)
MAEVTMPRLSDTMEEGTIASWLKKPGEQVNKGDVIAQIETDKATMDLTAFEAGTLQEILAPEGSTVAIGKPVARIGSGAASPPSSVGAAPGAPPQPPSSEPSTPAPPAPSASTEAPAPPATEGSAPPPAPERQPTLPEAPAAAELAAPAPPPRPSRGESNGSVRASPMARHIAAEHGLDLAAISGSGPQGRVIRADVEAAVNAQPAPREAPPLSPQSSVLSPAPDEERVPLSQMRRTIARRMAESTSTIPHFHLTISVDATELAALRKQVNEQLADAGVKVSVNDMIVKGAALAIRKVPEVNVSFAEDSLIRHSHVHVGIAVATDRGLIVPVVRDVDQKTVSQIAKEARDLAERSNSGKLQPPDYSGGTFTVSNLGMFGVEEFDAVINPPEAAILAVGAIVREPAEHQGEIVLRDRLKLTLAVDHRALDGATGARYLQALKVLLEKPMLLLV